MCWAEPALLPSFRPVRPYLAWLVAQDAKGPLLELHGGARASRRRAVEGHIGILRTGATPLPLHPAGTPLTDAWKLTLATHPALGPRRSKYSALTRAGTRLRSRGVLGVPTKAKLRRPRRGQGGGRQLPTRGTTQPTGRSPFSASHTVPSNNLPCKAVDRRQRCKRRNKHWARHGLMERGKVDPQLQNKNGTWDIQQMNSALNSLTCYFYQHSFHNLTWPTGIWGTIQMSMQAAHCLRYVVC